MNVPTAGPSYVRIQLSPPGFFLGDARVDVTLDGYRVLETSFMQGFDWWTEVAPGVHLVELALRSPIGLSRKRSYSVEVRPALVTIVVLEYSRMWGNLTERPKSVTYVAR